MFLKIFLFLNSYMRMMSIAVAAKKDGDNWKITNDLGLTLAMAPPLYDDIVLPRRQDEPPPSYDTLRFRQTTDVEEQNNAANECIVVACIENLNPSRVHSDDVLCRRVANSLDSSEEEDADREEDNVPHNSHLRKITNSSGSIHNLSSSQSSSKLCLEIENGKGDDSENGDGNGNDPVAKMINGSEEMCSNSSSRCSVETGFVSMGSSSSRNSGSEESPRHDVGATHVPLLDDKKDSLIDETSLPVQYKNQTVNGGDEIKFIDELGEDSSIVN